MKSVKNLLKIIIFLVLVVLAWYFGSIAYHNLTSDNAPKDIGKEQVNAESLGSGNEIHPRVDNELLFLLAGTDQNDGDSNGKTRSDTMMLIKINFKSGSIDIVSVPRDTRVPVNGELRKINSASSVGGMEMTLKTIRDWLDIDLDYYVRVNFESTVKIVDMLGGVEIDVPEVVAEGIGVEPGLQKLDGEMALEFVRFRKGYATGDYGRVQAQQAFMKAMLNELLKPKNILNFPNLLNLVDKEVDTNIPTSFALSKATSMGKFSSSSLQTHIIPGEGKYIGDISFFVYDREETINLRDGLYNEYRLNGVNYLENGFEE